MSFVSVVPTNICGCCGVQEVEVENLMNDIFVDGVEDDCGNVCDDKGNDK